MFQQYAHISPVNKLKEEFKEETKELRREIALLKQRLFKLEKEDSEDE